MSCPFVPEHSPPTSVAGWLSFLGAANTPTTGITEGVAAFAGQLSTAKVLLLEAVYQRRRLELKYSVSVPVTGNGGAKGLMSSLSSILTCPPGAAHPIMAGFVSGSMSMPRVRQSGPKILVCTMAPAPVFVGSIRSTALLIPVLGAASSGMV